MDKEDEHTWPPGPKQSVCLLGALLLLVACAVDAGPLERLIMPGPVIQGHSEVEQQCERCHHSFRQESQNALCLDCHEVIALDRKTGRGFHGTARAARGTECRDCHTEHVGRDADVVRLNAALFDHRLTEFVLKGAHQAVSCGSCHQTGKKYREAKSACIDCHRERSPHDKKVKQECERCHDQVRWANSSFDHDATHFKLRNRHAKAQCAACHPGDRYKDTPRACLACHAVQVKHGLTYGERCDSCHVSKSWDEIRFDHNRKTRFALKGRHQKTDCLLCHQERTDAQKPVRSCVACHQADDTHRGRLGEECAQCHNEERWSKQKFDHARDADYPLAGKHAKAGCSQCHVGGVTRKTKDARTCRDCHRVDDVHGDEGKRACGECHSVKGWREAVRFEHDLTRFPLIGLHATTLCEACHLNAQFRNTSDQCRTCHAAADVHERRLGEQCARCHTPNGWAIWRFDHQRDADYALEGKHEGLSCIACHARPQTSDLSLSTACGSCHRKDDVHRGGFSMACERCHNQDDFREISIGHR